MDTDNDLWSSKVLVNFLSLFLTLGYLYNADSLSWYSTVTFGLCLGYYISCSIFFFFLHSTNGLVNILANFPRLINMEICYIYMRLNYNTWIPTSESVSPVSEWLLEIKISALNLYSVWRQPGLLWHHHTVRPIIISDSWVLTFYFFHKFFIKHF